MTKLLIDYITEYKIWDYDIIVKTINDNMYEIPISKLTKDGKYRLTTLIDCSMVGHIEQDYFPPDYYIRPTIKDIIVTIKDGKLEGISSLSKIGL